MKVLHHLVGLLIVGLLIVDVSGASGNAPLKSKSKQYKNIKEQQKFEESNYGNSKYHIFEVHNRFGPSAGAVSSNNNKPATNAAGHSDNVAAPSEEIRIEHINAPADFPLDDPNLDATLLKVAAEDEDSQQLPSKNVNTNENIPVPFPSNYRHDIPKKTPKPTEFIEVRDDLRSSRTRQGFDSSAQYQRPSQQYSQPGYGGTFKGSDYLPPHQTTGPQAKPFNGGQFLPQVPGNNGDSNTFKTPDYLPPRTGGASQQSQQAFNGNQAFKGPDYLPPPPAGAIDRTQDRFNANQPFKGPDYLPPRQSGSGQLGQEINSANNQYKGPDYLPPRQSGSGQLGQEINSVSNQYKGPDYLPPRQSGSGQLGQDINSANNQYKGPDYLPPRQSGSGQLGPEINSVSNQYKGPDYLPPRQSGSGQLGQEINSANNQYKGPDYLPPYQSGAAQNSFKSNNVFKGPDYLPPLSDGSLPQESFGSNNPFKGPDYLPPHLNKQQQQQQQGGALNAPRYLPPGYDVQKPLNAEAAIAELHTLPEQSEDNQQYQQQVTVQTQIQVGAQQSSDIIYGTPKHGSGAQGPTTNYQATGYLPPGYDVQGQQLSNSMQGQQLSNSVQGQQEGSAVYQAPEYLPPNYNAPRPTATGQYQGGDGKSYSAPGYLPPGYDFGNPTTSEQGPNYQTGSQQSSAQFTAPQSYAQQQSHQFAQAGSQQSSGEVTATQSYGQQQSHTQAFQSQSENFNQQPFKASEYLPPTSGSHAQQAGQAFNNFNTQSFQSQSPQTFQGPDYLPPTAAPTTVDQQSYQTPGYLPPTPGQQAYQSPGYLPPTVATPATAQLQPTYMYPLSSYMTSVQPYERYGSTRKPFPEYGPPPTAPTVPVFLNNDDVAPMYQEPATRPQHYAPAMSYVQNSVTTHNYNAYTSSQQHNAAGFGLSEQTRQALQTFMPKDIRQDVTPSRTNAAHSATATATATTGATTTATTSSGANAKVQTSATASSRIRTVQIVKPNAVKTLKVLESLDHAGVKTIQILGHTNEEPMGEHRVVKVVSGHEKTVQTVKIFSDHQDVPPSNEYLPARRKRQPKKTVVKGRKRIEKK